MTADPREYMKIVVQEIIQSADPETAAAFIVETFSDSLRRKLGAQAEWDRMPLLLHGLYGEQRAYAKVAENHLELLALHPELADFLEAEKDRILQEVEGWMALMKASR